MVVPLVHIIRKIIVVQAWDDYAWYVAPDDEMITMMLHLPQDKICIESMANSIKEYTPDCKKDNTVYDILDQIWKDTDLYP